jgi:hypothetical protein
LYTQYLENIWGEGWALAGTLPGNIRIEGPGEYEPGRIGQK